MKKFYFFLTALLVAIAANATDYYLIGGFNKWALKQANCLFTAQGDGTYVLDYNDTLTTGFKINDGTWDNGAPNFGGSSTLKVGETYNLVSNGGNIPLSENIEKPHIVFNPTAKTLLITGQSVEAEYIYGIHGEIFSGSWETVNMTESDGKWVLSNKTVVAGEFGIKQMDKSTGAQADWISSAQGSTVTIGQAMDCKVEGTNWSIAAGTYTFTYDPKEMTLLVSGESTGEAPVETVDYTSWYVNIIGVFNGWVDNGTHPDAEGLNTHENLAIGTSEFKVKIYNGADVYYSTGGAIATGDWVVIDGNADNNMTIEGAAEGDVFNVDFDCAKHAIRVTKVSGGSTEPEEPDTPVTVDYTKWYVNIVGDFNEWKDNGTNPDAEGLNTHENLAIGNSGFKVKLYDGANDIYYSTGGAIATGDWIVIDGNAEANMTIEGAAEGDVFNVDFDCAKHAIRVAKVGGSSTEPENPGDDENYTGWYVNIVGNFNEWKENGKEVPETCITKHEGLAIGTSEFKVKIYDGSKDIYYSTGSAIAIGEWVKIEGNADANMTISGATEGQAFDVEFNCRTKEIKVTAVEGGNTTISMPEKLYIIGNVNNTNWATNLGVEMVADKSAGTFTAEKVSINTAYENDYGYFSFTTALGTTGDSTEWDEVINANDRYGAAEADTEITIGNEGSGSASFVQYAAGVNASAAASWKVVPQIYDITVDFNNNTVSLTKSVESIISSIVSNESENATYYNLQGVKVDQPSAGLYIEVIGNQVRKVIIK